MATERRLHSQRFTSEQARKLIFESVDHSSDSDDDDRPCSDASDIEYIPVPEDDVDVDIDAGEDSGDVSDAAGNDGPRKRKPGRCLLCDQSKDKKARTACNKCGCFACTDHDCTLHTLC